MSEIKEGEYIRTIKGNICKVLSIREKHRFVTSSGHPSVTPERYFVDNSKQYSISKPYVKKHSFDIIDLIEVGDIVNYEQLNGGVVLNKKDDSIDTCFILPNSLKNENIKSVITKEQLKKCMYEVGE